MLQQELKNGSMGSELPPLQALTPWEHQAGVCSAWTRQEPKAKVLLQQVTTHTCIFGRAAFFWGWQLEECEWQMRQCWIHRLSCLTVVCAPTEGTARARQGHVPTTYLPTQNRRATRTSSASSPQPGISHC